MLPPTSSDLPALQRNRAILNRKRREEMIDMPIMKTISQIRYFQF
jgi:hypothetical protein